MRVELTLLLRIGVAVVIAPLLAGAARAQTGAPPPAVPQIARDHAAELACGARTTTEQPSMAIRIAQGREHGKGLFGSADPIIVRAGTAEGLRVGQEYFVRRVIKDRFIQADSDGTRPISIHTAGWVRIVQVGDDAAVATITRACDAMQEGDYLEAFVLPLIPLPAAASAADYTNPGHLVLGDDRRQMGAAGDMMVFNRGTDHGLRAGQRVTIFRHTASGTGPVIHIGEAVAMVVGSETTTLKIEKSTDAVYVGDLVAIHR